MNGQPVTCKISAKKVSIQFVAQIFIQVEVSSATGIKTPVRDNSALKEEDKRAKCSIIQENNKHAEDKLQS